MFTRALKRVVARLSIAAVLLTQFALASYACPMPAGAGENMAAVMADDVHAGMAGCDKGVNNDTNMCLQHCHPANQSVQTHNDVSVPAATATASLAVVEFEQLTSELPRRILFASQERETSPPPLVRFGTLRI